jgi:hypothetical protein
MTKTTNDLEAVKAMLLGALKASKTKGSGEVYLLDQSNFTSLPKGEPFELWVDDNASFDADKLAATVMEFFAGREAEKNDRLAAEMSLGHNGTGPAFILAPEGVHTISFAGKLADLQRIAELEAERDDLADELDNVRSAFRDRWAAFRPKGGE